MNCTVCGKPHSKEQPLTSAYGHEMLCPDCLEEMDKVEDYKAKGFTQSTRTRGLFFPTEDIFTMHDAAFYKRQIEDKE